MYKITLADGTELENLTLNGNTYISAEPVTAEMLNEEALKKVTILEIPEDGEPIETIISHAKYDTIMHDSDGYHFVLWGESPEEKKIRELQETNDMLTECILEMSEVVYGE